MSEPGASNILAAQTPPLVGRPALGSMVHLQHDHDIRVSLCGAGVHDNDQTWELDHLCRDCWDQLRRWLSPDPGSEPRITSDAEYPVDAENVAIRRLGGLDPDSEPAQMSSTWVVDAVVSGIRDAEAIIAGDPRLGPDPDQRQNPSEPDDITDANGDEREHGEPDYPGQDPESEERT